MDKKVAVTINADKARVYMDGYKQAIKDIQNRIGNKNILNKLGQKIKELIEVKIDRYE